MMIRLGFEILPNALVVLPLLPVFAILQMTYDQVADDI
jgi:hypothetical protein